MKANLWLTSCFQASTGYGYSKKLKAAMSDSFERRLSLMLMFPHVFLVLLSINTSSECNWYVLEGYLGIKEVDMQQHSLSVSMDTALTG